MDCIKYNPGSEPLLRAQFEMKIDNYEVDFERLNNLAHSESLSSDQIEEPQPMEDLIEEITTDTSNVKLSTKNYKKYRVDQIEIIKQLSRNK
ncbi:hypothetical protein RMCBS344292_14255 [Rhizopus microsporus]|nr:hypothetical protein RMCBS344292_14255 [Rhizopus microsporus]